MENFDIVIDGSMGEGGGQVLRTAMSLSCILGKSLKIFNIRHKRDNPGLQKQHITSLSAASKICNGQLFGCSIGSKEFTFIPGKITSGDFIFDIQSAGSSILVLQTVVPILWFANGPSTVRVKGGTHNGLSPSFDFYKEVFCPLMPVQVQCELIRYGFYPAGGGEVFVKVDPTIKNIPLLLVDRGTLSSKTFTIIHSKLENTCVKINEKLRQDIVCTPIEHKAYGKGYPVLSAFYKYINFSEIINVYHQKDVEKTVENFTNLVDEYENSLAPVEEHLADQLLLPLALIGGGTYKAISINKYSKHFETNVDIIHMFLGPKINITQTVNSYEVVVQKLL